MTITDIPHLRLINQQIASSKFTSASELVGWMGAMQAQDIQMSKWAIGARLPGSSVTNIESAIDKAEIIRTHVMRPTWHYVSSEDIYWMLDLTAHRIKSAMKAREKELGLDEGIFRKSRILLENALKDGNHLSRAELNVVFEKAGIAPDNNRASHLLVRAEIDKIICSGSTKANQPTYALLPERVKQTKTLTLEEALAELAKRYFTSHGPATLKDFYWWSGLTINDSKRALEMIKSELTFETIEDQTYWFTNPDSISKYEKDSVYLLPAFDEFLISYKDRTASIAYEYHKKAISINGIFRPIIVADGIVVGIWKRTVKKDLVMFETEYFNSPGKELLNRVKNLFDSYADFINKSGNKYL
ncbi:MAG: winged helix DNA-binding domain-containing protein [Chloroflexia bacterium]|nr:winged helix DNA-binding domain-containing protein [Chloroflexia bacterium]